MNRAEFDRIRTGKLDKQGMPVGDNKVSWKPAGERRVGTDNGSCVYQVGRSLHGDQAKFNEGYENIAWD